MQATGYPHGKQSYGLRVRTADRDRFFDRAWKTVVIDLPGGPEVIVRIKPSFWDQCPELLSADISRWLQRNGLAPWARGYPPRITLEYMSGNHFMAKLPIER